MEVGLQTIVGLFSTTCILQTLDFENMNPEILSVIFYILPTVIFQKGARDKYIFLTFSCF